jgi:lantibiotic modifying enzyme
MKRNVLVDSNLVAFMKMDATTGLGVLVCITSQKVREKMDRKKAIKILKQRECCMECVVTDCNCNECDKAFEMAIKALEQESAIDKIRAEIEDLTYYCCEVHPRNVIDDVLKIIDKYRESEG